MQALLDDEKTVAQNGQRNRRLYDDHQCSDLIAPHCGEDRSKFHGCSLSMLGGEQTADRLDGDAQERGRAIRSQNFGKSMLPPDTTATMGPWPAFPVSAAARDKDPAPSAMMRVFSAIKRIASFVSCKLTTMVPSTTGLIRSHMRGNRLCPPAPSTKDAFHSLNT